MKKTILFAALALAVSAWAQEKKMTESELLLQLDKIDPNKKPAISDDSQPKTIGKNTDLPGEKSESKKKAKGPTEITSDSVTFDNKKHIAIFVGNVVVKDPEFDMTCDKLTAYLRHDDPVPAAGGDAPKATPKPAGAAKEKKGGLERAVAEGNVVITQEKIESGGNISKSIGRSKRADYDAKTGDVVLTGRPRVKQGINQCDATADETVMTLNRDRDMKVTGPNKVTITDKGDLEDKPDKP